MMLGMMGRPHAPEMGPPDHGPNGEGPDGPPPAR